MITEELIDFYAEKKRTGLMDLSAIKLDLEKQHNLSKEESKLIASQIADRELELINNKPSLLRKITTSKYYSMLFVVLGVVVIIFSILAIQKNVQTTFGKTLPWIVLIGGFFLIIKHLTILLSNKNGI